MCVRAHVLKLLMKFLNAQWLESSFFENIQEYVSLLDIIEFFYLHLFWLLYGYHNMILFPLKFP